YAHGYPRFCVSIGVQRRGEPCVGVVYDPLLDELFAATRGEGANCNGRTLRVSDERELGRALLATGFAYDVHRSLEDNLDHFAAFVKRVRGLRRDGSAALALCYVAAGNLMVDEAGGRTSDLAGRPPSGDGRETVASNGHLHDAMIALLSGGTGTESPIRETLRRAAAARSRAPPPGPAAPSPRRPAARGTGSGTHRS